MLALCSSKVQYDYSDLVIFAAFAKLKSSQIHLFLLVGLDLNGEFIGLGTDGLRCLQKSALRYLFERDFIEYFWL